MVRSLVQALLEGRRIGMMGAASGSGNAPAATPSSGSTPAATPSPATTPATPPPRESGPPERPLDTAPVASESPRSTPEERAGNSPRISETSPFGPIRRRMFAASLGYVATPFDSLLGWQSGMTFGMRWLVLPFAYVGGSYALFPRQLPRTTLPHLPLAGIPSNSLSATRGRPAWRRRSSWPRCSMSFIARPSKPAPT